MTSRELTNRSFKVKMASLIAKISGNSPETFVSDIDDAEALNDAVFENEMTKLTNAVNEGGGGSVTPILATVTITEEGEWENGMRISTATCDKTYSEIVNALESGTTVYVRIGNSGYPTIFSTYRGIEEGMYLFESSITFDDNEYYQLIIGIGEEEESTVSMVSEKLKEFLTVEANNVGKFLKAFGDGYGGYYFDWADLPVVPVKITVNGSTATVDDYTSQELYNFAQAGKILVGIVSVTGYETQMTQYMIFNYIGVTGSGYMAIVSGVAPGSQEYTIFTGSETAASDHFSWTVG